MINFILKKNNFSHFEIQQIASLHSQGLENAFLTSLGQRFLEILFHHISISNFSILIAAIDCKSGDVIGYNSATINLIKFYLSFIINYWYRILHILPNLSLKLLFKIFELVVFYPIKDKQFNITSAEGLSFVVDLDSRGSPVSTILWTEMFKELHNKRINTFKAISYSGLSRAHTFFRKMGGKVICITEIHRGESSYIFIFPVP
jgi:hypothetical protein